MFRNKIFISDYYRNLLQEIQKQILNEEDNYIIQANINELVEYYFFHNCLMPIEFDDSRQESFEHKKELRTVSAHKREGFYQNEGDLDFEYESIVVTIPIIQNENLNTILDLQSSTYSLSGDPCVNLGRDVVLFNLDIKGYKFNYDDAKITSLVQQEKNNIVSWINRKNNDINKENEQFKQNIKNFIENRKQKLAKDNQRINSLITKINIPLKKKQDASTTKIKLDPKPLIKKVKPYPGQQEEYVLDSSKVIDIISIIDNQGKQFEKTPKTYKGFKEENLRDVILVSLNAIFEGKATGETFSNKGKTDIYLNIDKGNILVCECKIWSGESLCYKTIDQLLGYLTWRNNFGIIITFVRQKNLNKILDNIESVVSQHSSYETGFHKRRDTHFVSCHKLNQDKFKKVEIHHLFYNLYSD